MDEKSTSSNFSKSKLYEEFLLEREEILRHKWLESEKKCKDVGFDVALLDWVRNHRSKWRDERKNVIAIDVTKSGIIEVDETQGQASLLKKVFKHESLSPNAESEHLISQKGTKVLVVEDDTFSQDFFQNFLGEYGFEVQVASTYDDAIARFRRHQHSIIVADIHLSNNDLKHEGLQVVRGIREFAKGSPMIVAISADVQKTTQEISFESGCDYFFEKPIDLDDFILVLYDMGYLSQK